MLGLYILALKLLQLIQHKTSNFALHPPRVSRKGRNYTEIDWVRLKAQHYPLHFFHPASNLRVRGVKEHESECNMEYRYTYP